MSKERQQALGVIDSLRDPDASILENYILTLEAERDVLKKFCDQFKDTLKQRDDKIESLLAQLRGELPLLDR